MVEGLSTLWMFRRVIGGSDFFAKFWYLSYCHSVMQITPGKTVCLDRFIAGAIYRVKMQRKIVGADLSVNNTEGPLSI